MSGWVAGGNKGENVLRESVDQYFGNQRDRQWRFFQPRKSSRLRPGKLENPEDLLLSSFIRFTRRFHNQLLHGFANMPYCVLLLLIAVSTQATMYIPPLKEDSLLTDTMFRELINQMGNELIDAADSYLDYQDKSKEIPMELPADYEGIDTLNPNPSIRDQEYLQHSSLWSHSHANNDDKINDRHKIKPESLKDLKDDKNENSLPAYCTPPNPCPLGYTSENHCLVDFENTASFSRDYQSAQDCMCDTEHMIDCSNNAGSGNNLPSVRISNSDFSQIVEQFQEENPFFRGEKLPIAAKKGTNVAY